MPGIPEEAQAEALRAVAEASLRRAETIAQLDRDLREAVLAAVRTGANRSRIRSLAGISPNTLYGWLAAEGIEIRAKAPAKKKGES
ncbi:hypothetical protein EES41_41080 (plasmid) [Streptomyces sp. ADI95-16]|uniref:hypothetical protein n=1 Tax=Streptomyces sp. ADI95-16 TaxID=1522758 RepID=UPI000F437D14|nr:hypothetical protein [Streptomyces sp. ADI95-16]AYV33174.1 hypothetical protein EES41_41080 [Streptomyces sp. ADI95-16]